MPQNEKVLWEILSLMHSNTTGWTNKISGQEPVENKIENGFGIHALKGRLVLKYRPDDIEDTIYFMWHRNYLAKHGQGMINPDIAYSLSEKALEVIKQGKLPEDEEHAFKESLWDIKPKLWGMGPNLSEWLRRAKKIK